MSSYFRSAVTRARQNCQGRHTVAALERSFTSAMEVKRRHVKSSMSAIGCNVNASVMY